MRFGVVLIAVLLAAVSVATPATPSDDAHDSETSIVERNADALMAALGDHHDADSYVVTESGKVPLETWINRLADALAVRGYEQTYHGHNEPEDDDPWPVVSSAGGNSIIHEYGTAKDAPADICQYARIYRAPGGATEYGPLYTSNISEFTRWNTVSAYTEMPVAPYGYVLWTYANYLDDRIYTPNYHAGWCVQVDVCNHFFCELMVTNYANFVPSIIVAESHEGPFLWPTYREVLGPGEAPPDEFPPWY